MCETMAYMKITLLPYALERMEERGSSEEKVHDILERPDLEYTDRLGRTVAERSPSEVGRSLVVHVNYNRSLEDERIVVAVEMGRPTTSRRKETAYELSLRA